MEQHLVSSDPAADAAPDTALSAAAAQGADGPSELSSLELLLQMASGFADSLRCCA